MPRPELAGSVHSLAVGCSGLCRSWLLLEPTDGGLDAEAATKGC